MSAGSAEAIANPLLAHPRTALVEFLGAFVRQRGGWAPVSAIVGLMREVGVDGASVRTLVSRLKSRGWLEPDRRGGAAGYRLTALALSELAAGDELVWRVRQPASLADGWVLVTFSVPESERAKRHLLRSRLASLGFGSIGSGVWIAPARMLSPARTMLQGLELADFVDLFTAQVPPGEDVVDIVRRGWDLAGLNDEYLGFVRNCEPVLKQWEAEPGTDAEAFRDYVVALNQWRQLPFHDPGLPTELLGDEWGGQLAGQVFVGLAGLLETAAHRHAAGFWPERADARSSGSSGS